MAFFVNATSMRGVACVTHESYVLVSLSGEVTPEEVVMRFAVPFQMLEGQEALTLAE